MAFSAHGVAMAVVSVYRHLPCAGHLLCDTGMGNTSVNTGSPSPTRVLLRKGPSHSASGSLGRDYP